MFSTPNSNTIDLESMQFNESDDVSNLDVVMSTLELNDAVVNCDDIDFSATERPATPQPQPLSFLQTPSIETPPLSSSTSSSSTSSSSSSSTLTSTSKLSSSSSSSQSTASLSSAIAALTAAASSTSVALRALSLQNQLNPGSTLYPRLTGSRGAAFCERYPLRRYTFCGGVGGGGGGSGGGGSGGARNINPNLNIGSSSSRSAYGGSDSDSDISYISKDKKLHGVQNNAITRRRSILINPTEREIRKFYLNESLNIRPFKTDLETVFEEVIETKDDIVINGHHGNSRGIGIGGGGAGGGGGGGGGGGTGIGGGVNAIVNNRILNNFGGIVSGSSDSSNRANVSAPMSQIVDPNRFLIRRRIYKRSLSCSDFTVAKSTVMIRKRTARKQFNSNQVLWHQVPHDDFLKKLYDDKDDKDKDDNSV